MVDFASPCLARSRRHCDPSRIRSGSTIDLALGAVTAGVAAGLGSRARRRQQAFVVGNSRVRRPSGSPWRWLEHFHGAGQIADDDGDSELELAESNQHNSRELIHLT